MNVWDEKLENIDAALRAIGVCMDELDLRYGAPVVASAYLLHMVGLLARMDDVNAQKAMTFIQDSLPNIKKMWDSKGN